jgi:hypothetical protein
MGKHIKRHINIFFDFFFYFDGPPKWIVFFPVVFSVKASNTAINFKKFLRAPSEEHIRIPPPRGNIPRIMGNITRIDTYRGNIPKIDTYMAGWIYGMEDMQPTA